MKRCFPLIVILLYLVSCNKHDSTKSVDVEKAKAFLNNLVNTMEQNSLRKNSIDWKVFREKVLQRVDDYNVYMANCQRGILQALNLLADNHSSFTFTDGKDLWGEVTIRCSDTIPAMIPFDSTIGYVKVGTFTSQDPIEGIRYYTSIHKQIQETDNRSIKGWIVDLRSNRGGNFYPMLMGVAPVLGAGIAMNWVYPDSSYLTTSIDTAMLTKFYHLITPNPKVAVLTDNGIASSGEAVVICFKGRPKTRSFGNGTCGVSTERRQYNIGDVGRLNLTVGVMADRNRTLYGGSVMPDEIEPSTSRAMQKAIAWLKQ